MSAYLFNRLVSSQTVRVSDLVTVDFRPEEMTERLKRWRNELRAFISSNCERHVWFGSIDDFHDFPCKDLDPDRLTCAEDAYASLAAYAAGISGNEIDTHNRNQFREIGRILEVRSPERYARFRDLIRCINEDVKLADKYWLQGHRPTRADVVARDLSGQKKQERVLLVGELTTRGNLSLQTSGLLRALGAHKSRHASEIFVAHPDPVILEKIQKRIQKLEGGMKLRSKVSPVPFEDVPRIIESTPRVYDCTEPHRYQGRQFLVSCWQGRIAQEGILTFLPDDVGLDESLLYQGFGTSGNIVMPSDVVREIKAREDSNVRILNRAREGLGFCAQLRVADITPNKAVICELAPELL